MTDRRTTRRRTTRALAAATSGVLLSLVAPTTAAATGAACEERRNNSYEKLLECVTLEGVRAHQKRFQQIANRSGDPVYPGTRAAGTRGYDRSAAYVAGLMREAGYEVTLDPVEFTFNFPPTLRQLAPGAARTYETGPFGGSASGRVTGSVIPVDINLTGDRASTSGCETADFAGLDFGGDTDIALIQRGECTFGLKAFNASEAGAEAVIIFNQGNAPDRMDLIIGDATTLDLEGTQPVVQTVPIVGASFADGRRLAAPGSRALVDALAETRTDFNVIAEKRGKNRDNVVMAGAHLDSVVEGPGINDNGSGSAALLETAIMMQNLRPQNTIRFAWWAAEEIGLLGSTDYVEGLSQAERDRIALYMNYDMIGSPNHVQMVYDADQSTFEAPVPIPAGSAAIEQVYERYYTKIGEPYDDTEFSGRSDYQAFILAGIPSGGLFTGAEEVKTPEQEAIWGGTAGEPFDACYHEACDTFRNVDLHALDVNSDLVAFAMIRFAYSTERVNGVPGRKVPVGFSHLPVRPAGPEGTFTGSGGGGLHPEHGVA